MKGLGVISLCFIANILVAQVVNERYNFFYNEEKHASLEDQFSAFKASFNDSIFVSGLVNLQAKKSNFIFNPAISASYYSQNVEEKSRLGYGFGAETKFYRKKWRAQFTYFNQKQQFVSYQHSFIEKNKVVPGMNVAHGSSTKTAEVISGFVNFNPNDIFNFELGYGKQFIGDGYRSLLRSDAANSSPYLKITTQFWKLKYTNLFESHQNIFNVEGFNALYQKKYSASHFLDWAATKWLTIGLFETIVWQAKEGNYTRGFDPNYANPFIFYRPVEFSVGSSDNALVGANIKIKPFKNSFFYAQVVFDEFLLDELKADVKQFTNPEEDIQSGWWANKYGLQLGYNAFDVFQINGLQTRVEFNLVRPFTYAHSSATQAYSNYNISLAHPLGANFHELLTILSYTKNKMRFSAKYVHTNQGFSLSGTNFGENLQLSNTTRVKEYENEIAQGLKSTVHYLEFSAGYLVNESWNTTVNAGYVNRQETFNGANTQNNFLYISLKTNLYNSYFDY